VIDAHQHVWQLGRNGCVWPTAAEGPIYRDYGLADFRGESAPAAVSGSVLVQSQEDARDTDWLLDLAESDDLVAAVVGWADFAAPDAVSRITSLAARPKLKALRPMVQDKAADWYDNPALEPAFAAMVTHGLRLDALVRVQHLAALDRLAERFPDSPIVIDHAAKPRIAAPDGFDEWHAAIAPLAARPNVFCKLSGLLTECAGAPADAIGPYAHAILALFGPGRTMWGSDWPVLELASSYGEWLRLSQASVPAVARDDVFGRTAAHFYGFKEALKC
jgi:L-fuconolactonase